MYLLVAILVIIALAVLCDLGSARHRQRVTGRQMDDTARSHEEHILHINEWHQ